MQTLRKLFEAWADAIAAEQRAAEQRRQHQLRRRHSAPIPSERANVVLIRPVGVCRGEHGPLHPDDLAY
jgi:hypothetical protein